MKSQVINAHKNEDVQVYNQRLGVSFDGSDNLKPLVIENLIRNSPTATQCNWLYGRFLVGAGFEVDLTKVNLKPESVLVYSPNNLLFDVGEDIAKFQSACVHVRYNANLQKISFRVLPRMNVRKGKVDSADYAGKYLYSKKGWGKQLKKDEIICFDAYNPRPEVIAKQIEAAGGIQKWNGQVMFISMSSKYVYPFPLIETAYLFADTEYQMGMYYNSTARRGFEDITIVRHGAFPDKKSEEDLINNLKEIRGFENAGSILKIEDKFDNDTTPDGNFRFDKITNNATPQKYDAIQSACSNYIRKAYKNIPPQLVDYIQGKLGNTTGEDLIKAQSVYNATLSSDQEILEQYMAELFDNYVQDINPNKTWTIKQYSLLDDGTVNYEGQQNDTPEQLAAKEVRTAQATLRGSVGGVTAVLAIQTSVANQTTSYDAGVAMLENIFGYSNEVAKKMLGEPKTNPNPDPNANPVNQ